MKQKSIQHQFPGPLGEAFNLVGECGEDPARIIRERLVAAAAAAAAREYQLKMQRTFARCPGFIGGDAPSSEQSMGHVIFEPAKAREARDWLRRRFYINESLELCEQGLCLEIIPRTKPARGARRVRVSFAKPEQFKLAV